MFKLHHNSHRSDLLAAGPLVLDIQERRAVLAGRTLSLGGRAFGVLLELMRHPQHLCTKDELIDTVWEGRAVSDAVLTTAMKEVRSELNDPARQPEYIQTVHGKGYRFLRQVEALESATSEQHDPIQIDQSSLVRTAGMLHPAAFFCMLIAAMAVGAFLGRLWPVASQPTDQQQAFSPDDRSIAVLPFIDLSPQGDQAYFSEGVSEELLNVLAGIDGLKVASRTSSFVFKDADKTGLTSIARALNVRYVLEGSLRKSGDTVRVTAQLIDALNDQHLWSETFDRTVVKTSVLDIQDNVSAAIVPELLVHMGLDELVSGL